ncbi:hypothetical protein [Peribacillus sp. Hz7]|uniref:hypothetical protein n=1 Tax=Peribacillus sp. Hz7 TaxID=3344873 RepID=UPI0035CC6328
MRKMTECKIVSVQYVHHPEAAQKWFDLYTNLILKELENRQGDVNNKEELNE